MVYQCELLQKDTQPVLSVRTRTPVYELKNFLGEAYEMIMQYVAELGEEFAGPPFAAYYNMDMQDLDVEAGFPVAHQLPGKGRIQSTEIPAGNYAATIHIGPYAEAEKAYAELNEWVIKQGHQPTGIVYECYLNDPNEIPEDQLQEQILYQLK
jgi:effector-binding domain-containing protein